MKDNQKITPQTELYEKILKVKLSSRFQTALIWKWLHIKQYFTKVNVSWIQGLFVHPSRFLKYQASPEIWEPPLCYVDGGSSSMNYVDGGLFTFLLTNLEEISKSKQ